MRASVMPRRAFLELAAIGSGATVYAVSVSAAPAGATTAALLTDVNVSLGRWPFRRLPLEEPDRLVHKLRSCGVTQAWVGSFDGLLHKDLAAANARLAEDCQRHGHGLLLPFGSINPGLPGWERDLQRCSELHHMRGIRLHPNYHGYQLGDPAFARLLQMAAEYHLIVQLALAMEDDRAMHPLLRLEPVDPAPLVPLVSRTPGLRLMLINALRSLRGEALRTLLTAGDIGVEISMLEGVGGVGRLLEQVPTERVFFGSHAPLYYFEAAQLKLKESPLTPEQGRAISHGNAQRFLAGSG